MPNRILRDWTDSESINTLTATAEVFFARLIMKADDYGRFTANPQLLRSLMFPLKDGIRNTDISRDLAACEKAGLIRCYADPHGKPLLEIVKFNQRMRLKRDSKYAPPTVDGHMAGACPSHDGIPPPETNANAQTNANAHFGDEGASCGEAALPLPAVLEFPVVGLGAKVWALNREKLDEYAASFPGCDVLSECRAARQWCIDNPTKRKTPSGMGRFLTSWLTRAQERKGSSNGNGTAAVKRSDKRSGEFAENTSLPVL